MPIPLLQNGRFTVREISERMSRAPRKPTFLRQYANFQYRGIRSLYVDFQLNDKTLQLIPTTERGAPPHQNVRDSAKLKSVKTLHIAVEDHVSPDEVTGLALLTDTGDVALATLTDVVDDRTASLRERIEDTLSYHELGAFQGRILDSDGQTIVADLFAELGVTPTTIDFGLESASAPIKAKCRAVRIAMQTGMYGDAFNGIVGFCGESFYEALLGSNEVKDAETTTALQQAIVSVSGGNAGEESVLIGGIRFVLALGSVAGQPFVAANEVRFGPIGTANYRGAFAPGTLLEAAGQTGQPFYGATREEDYGRGIGIYAESNPLAYVRRPEAMIRGTV